MIQWLIDLVIDWLVDFFFAETPFGQMPILEYDGDQICQAQAINRFLSEKFGMLESLFDCDLCMYVSITLCHKKYNYLLNRLIVVVHGFKSNTL